MKENSIWIKAPARLHFGFVDLNGSTGRRFGSLGMAIDGFDTCLQVSRSRFVKATGVDRERAGRYASRLLDATPYLFAAREYRDDFRHTLCVARRNMLRSRPDLHRTSPSESCHYS